MYTVVYRYNTLTLSSEIVQEGDFSDTACNSAYVSDVQSLISKIILQLFFSCKFLTQKIEMHGEI